MQYAKLRDIKTDHNNWVIPGFVMAGPFPGVDGTNFPDEQTASANIQGILSDGINAFISLCDELPDQLDSTTPVTHPHFPKYKSYADIVSQKPPNITYHHFKIKDQSTPTKHQLIAIITTILTLLSQDKRVFIHCAGGHGRTGLIVAALLIALYDIPDPDQALYFVQYTHNLRRKIDLRTSAHPFPVRSPNTTEQCAMVRDWATFIAFSTA
jgi:hypothetical protein